MKIDVFRRIPVLLYHKIGPAPQGARNPRRWISVDRFAWQMNHLVRRDYRTITTGELAAHYRGEKEADRRAILITFDDGSRTCYAQAYPVMRDLGLTATVFIVAGYIGRRASWDRGASHADDELLSMEEIGKLVNAGWDIGAHSMTHTRMTGLPIEEAEHEIRVSKTILEGALSMPVRAFGYPYGWYVKEHTEIVRRAGYELGFTTHYPQHGLYAIQRENIHGEVNALRFLWRFRRAKRGTFRHVES